MDIHFLGLIENSEETITSAFRAILEYNGIDNGIVYDACHLR